MGFFGNMMNNYFYGKAGQADYTVQSMPQNRLQLFGAVMKVRWSSIIGITALYMVFWLPTLIWTLLNVSVLMSEELMSQAQSYVMMYMLGLIPCIGITGPFTAGFTYVFRNWSRDEHSFVWSDFWDAVKQNWKLALPISIISGFMPFLMYIGWIFYGGLMSTNLVFAIPLGLLIIIFALWKLSEMVIYTMMVTYDYKVRDLIRNGFLLTLARLPQALGIKLLTWIFPAICFALALIIPQYQMAVLLVAVLLYCLYIPGLNRMIICSFANAQCEKYLNTNIEGAKTNIGLRPEDWDDTEYIPQDDEE